MTQNKLTWKAETLYSGYQQRFAVLKKLYTKQSQFQKIEIVETALHGRALFLDGILQLTEKDEYIYHEMISHVPLVSHPNPKNVLVIGGGDGGVIRRVLEHSTVTSVTLIEIDKHVIEASKMFLPTISKQAFFDPRLTIEYTDGDVFVATTTDTFDVIITDRGDDIGPGQTLYAKKFYQNCYRILNKNGILVSMTGVPLLQPATLQKSFALLSKIFPFNTCYRIAVPTYIGGEMAITWSGKNIHPTKTSNKQKNSLETSYYTPKMHQAAFVLPPYIQKLLQ